MPIRVHLLVALVLHVVCGCTIDESDPNQNQQFELNSTNVVSRLNQLVTDNGCANHAAVQQLTLCGSPANVPQLPDNVFDQMINLKILSLNFCKLNQLQPKLFWKLTNLQEITLSSNNLESLPPSVFHTLTQLQTLLTLEYNKLYSLPPTVFDSFTQLQTDLHLSMNYLTSLPPNVFDSLTRLTQKLLLGGNKLLSLPDGVFSKLTAFQYSGDVSSCSCGVEKNGLLAPNALTSLPAGLFDSFIWAQPQNQGSSVVL